MKNVVRENLAVLAAAEAVFLIVLAGGVLHGITEISENSRQKGYKNIFGQTISQKKF